MLAEASHGKQASHKQVRANTGESPPGACNQKKKEICTQPTPLAGPGHCLRPLVMMGDDAAWYGDSCQSPKDLPCMAPDDSLFRYGP